MEGVHVLICFTVQLSTLLSNALTAAIQVYENAHTEAQCSAYQIRRITHSVEL